MNMAFSLTTEQIRARTKSVTRRRADSWKSLKPGDELTACVRTMGLPKGAKVEKLGRIRVVSVRVEPLDAITDEDVIAEGFEGMSRKEFVAHFLKNVGGSATQEVRRIEFCYIDKNGEDIKE